MWTQYGLKQTSYWFITMVAIRHSNLVTIATRYVADAYHPNKVSYQIWKELFT